MAVFRQQDTSCPAGFSDDLVRCKDAVLAAVEDLQGLRPSIAPLLREANLDSSSQRNGQSDRPPYREPRLLQSRPPLQERDARKLLESQAPTRPNRPPRRARPEERGETTAAPASNSPALGPAVKDIEEVLATFRPTHRCKTETLRRILDSDGCLLSKHVCDAAPEQALLDRVRNDVRIRAWSFNFRHAEHGDRHIQKWLCARASVQLAERQGLQGAQLQAKVLAEQEALLKMLKEHGWGRQPCFKRFLRQPAGSSGLGSSFLGMLGLGVGAVGLGAAAVCTGFGALAVVAMAADCALVASGATIVAAGAGMVMLGAIKAFEVLGTVAGGQTLFVLSGQDPTEEAMYRIKQELESLHLGTEAKRQMEMADRQTKRLMEEAKKLEDAVEKMTNAVQAHVDETKIPDKTGIGCPVDLQLGTNRQIFSVIGPHFGHYYGEDVLIILKQELMRDPDFDFTPCAGTSFVSGGALNWEGRPAHTWLLHGDFKNKAPVQRFHMAKLNAGVSGWLTAAASALATTIANQKGRCFWSLGREAVYDFYTTVDSHCVLEGHLPCRVPLGQFAERVVIKESAWNDLEAERKQALLQLVGEARVQRVPDTVMPAAVIKYCVEGLPSLREEGFRIFTSPMTYRPLRGIRPRSTARATLSFRWKGTFQLLLGSRALPGAGCILCFGGKLALPAGTDLGSVQDSALEHLQADVRRTFLDCQSQLVTVVGDGALQASSSPHQCLILDPRTNNCQTLPDLSADPDGWHDCRVEIGPEGFFLTDLRLKPADRVANSARSEGQTDKFKFVLDSVAIQTGLADATITNLTVS